MITAYLGIGSNLDNPLAQVRLALKSLAAVPDSRLLGQSSLYRSAPLGSLDQPHYINAVASIQTALDPLALLDAMQAIELTQGRVRTGERWGPRTLDLDILLYGDEIISTERLTVPHPGLQQRNFVLYPLQELAPQLVLPGLGGLDMLLAACSADGLERIGPV